MKIVDTAVRPPGMCLVSRDTDGPFFDTGVYARHHDPYMYIGTRWVEEAAQELGMVRQAEVDAMREQLANMETELSELRAFMEVQGEFEEQLSKRGLQVAPSEVVA
jgi:hypothetical protein